MTHDPLSLHASDPPVLSSFTIEVQDSASQLAATKLTIELATAIWYGSMDDQPADTQTIAHACAGNSCRPKTPGRGWTDKSRITKAGQKYEATAAK